MLQESKVRLKIIHYLHSVYWYIHHQLKNWLFETSITFVSIPMLLLISLINITILNCLIICFHIIFFFLLDWETTTICRWYHEPLGIMCISNLISKQSVSQGSWIVKQSVGKKACLVGQALEINYFHGKNYLEVSYERVTFFCTTGWFFFSLSLACTLVALWPLLGSFLALDHS